MPGLLFRTKKRACENIENERVGLGSESESGSGSGFGFRQRMDCKCDNIRGRAVQKRGDLPISQICAVHATSNLRERK